MQRDKRAIAVDNNIPQIARSVELPEYDRAANPDPTSGQPTNRFCNADINASDASVSRWLFEYERKNCRLEQRTDNCPDKSTERATEI